MEENLFPPDGQERFPPDDDSIPLPDFIGGAATAFDFFFWDEF